MIAVESSVGSVGTSATGGRRRLRLRPGTLATGCFHLAGLVGAGVPLVEALDQIAAGEPRRAQRALWRGLAVHVAGGAPLSVALADVPGCFDAELVALCRAGEADGALGVALGEMEAALAARHEFGRRSRTALAYPLFAAAVLGATVLFLFGEVVPALDASGFGAGDGDTSASWHASLLRGVASAVAAWGPILTLVLLSTWSTWKATCRAWPALALVDDRFALRLLPGARLHATLETARLAGTLARLHRRDASLVDALALALTGVTRPALRTELDAVRLRVVAGAGFGAALTDARHVSPTLARFARAGEAAGTLPDALERAAASLERDARTALERLERLAGPVLLCAVGAVLTWIVVSIVLPVYDAAIAAGVAS